MIKSQAKRVTWNNWLILIFSENKSIVTHLDTDQNFNFSLFLSCRCLLLYRLAQVQHCCSGYRLKIENSDIDLEWVEFKIEYVNFENSRFWVWEELRFIWVNSALLVSFLMFSDWFEYVVTDLPIIYSSKMEKSDFSDIYRTWRILILSFSDPATSIVSE